MGQAFKSYSVLGVLSIIWGLAFVAIKWAESVLTPVNMALLRWLLASAGFIVLVPFFGKMRTRFERRDIPRFLVVSFANVAAYHLALYNAERTISAGLAGLLVSTGPVFVVLLSWLLLRERHGKEIAIAVILAFSGAIVLAQGNLSSGGSPIGVLEAIGAALSYAVMAVLSKPLVQKYGAMPFTIWMCLTGTVMILPLMSGGFVQQVVALPAMGWIAMLYLSFLSTVFAYMAFYTLLGTGSVSRLSIQLYLVPVVSVIGGVVLLSEHVTVFTVIGGVLMLAAIAIVTMKNSVRKRAGGD